MIYRVVLDDTYDLHTSDIDCMLLNPSLELEMNSAGSFNFTLPPTHPHWDRIEILKSTIDVYEDDDLIFTGRVANIDKNWNNERVVECEGALAYFNDSIHRQNKWENPIPIAVDPDDQPEDPAQHRQNFLEDILNNHNAFVGNAVNRQIHMGHIYVDPFFVTREVDYYKTLDILTRMCIDTNGGYFMIRKDPETHLLYLDWLKDFTEESGQPASFGVNLLDFNTGLHAEDICTGVLARGATVNDQVVTLSNVELVDETTYPDLSVDHYTDRYQDILWHREGVSKFGQVVQVHDFPDAQTDWKNGGQVVANSLFEEARKWLEEKNTKIESIEVEVAELSWLQEGVPKYELGQIVEILDDAHMAGEPYEVRRLPMYKLSCDLVSGSKKVTLGRPPKKELTQISASNSDSSTLSSGNSSGSSSGGGSGSGEDCKVHDVRVDGTSVVSNKIANISLTGKADVSTVNALAATVANKADTATVNALANVVSGKQDQIEFNTLEAATETLTRLKANNIVYNIPSGGGGSANIDSGTADPSGGNDGDLYLKISTTATDQDVFGTPVSNTGNNYEISTDVTIYSTYDAYKAFGTGDGWGKNGQGSANLIYHFKNGNKAKIKSLTYCNNFNVSGGYLCSYFTFYGSNDGTNWTQLYVAANIITRDTTATVAIYTDTYYEYFKFACSYNNGYTGLKGIVCIGDVNTVDPGIENIFFKDNGVWLKDKFSKEEELNDAISELQSNFQDGVDDIYDACVSKGSTPASTALADVVQGILDIPSSGVEGYKYLRTRYTNLGFTLSNWVFKLTDSFELIFKMMDSPSKYGQWPGFMGIESGSGNYHYSLFHTQFNFYAGRTCLNIAYDGVWAGDGNISYTSPFDYDNFYKFKLENGTFTMLKGSTYDDISTVVFTYSRPVGSDADTNTVKLLKHTLTAQAAMDINIYGLKVWRDGNLIHNYIPGSTGLHDAVDNTDYAYDVTGCSYGIEYPDDDTIVT